MSTRRAGATSTLPAPPPTSAPQPAQGLRWRPPPPPGASTGTFWLLAAVVAVLNMIGLVMVLSASSVTALRLTGSTWSYFQRQAIWTAVGVVGLLALTL